MAANIEPSHPMQPMGHHSEQFKATPDTSTANTERPTTPCAPAATYYGPSTATHAPYANTSNPEAAPLYNPGPPNREYTYRRVLYTPNHVRHEWNHGSHRRVFVILSIIGVILCAAIVAIVIGLRYGYYRNHRVSSQRLAIYSIDADPRSVLGVLRRLRDHCRHLNLSWPEPYCTIVGSSEGNVGRNGSRSRRLEF